MLYVTKTSTEWPKLYYVSLDTSSDLVFAYTRTDSKSFLSIIDIDEIDACALVLKGVQLIKIKELKPANNGRHYIIVDDLSAVVELWYEVLYKV